MRKRTLYIILVLFGFSLSVFSQQGKADVEDADEHYKHGNYIMALPIYRDILKKEKNNRKVQFKLAMCYLNTNYNRTEAIKHLESITEDPKCDEEAWFQLGRAYHQAGKVDDAIIAFNKFKQLAPKKFVEEVARNLEMCNNAKIFMENPVNVAFTNLGKEINSEDPDYYPFVSSDETFMVFTSRRKENIGGKKVEVDGYHPSDIWFSKVEAGKWTKATNPGNIINGALDEQAVWMKPDGSEMMVYLDHIEKFGDLYLSKRNAGGDFMKWKPLPNAELINEKIETSGCFGPDGNVIFFARRDKVESKNDIYSCRKLPNGKWGMPYKLPDEINTPYNEDFPSLSPDGLTLYFASEGHNSMGGYDLFKSTYNPENNTWSKAVNLGFPINSTTDDRSISITSDNRAAYISTWRPGSFGDLDIYRIRFNDNEQIVRIFTGKISLSDTIYKRTSTIVTIIAKNVANNEEFTFVPNSKTGKYVVALGAGTYKLSIHAIGYEVLTEEMVISDIGKIEIEKNDKNYVLTRKAKK
ncbi:MAG: PD40 domain-containing protein [Bacteroidetes bacterium]|nr:PD40 domain-containing protein [Bacteroidota bacterium]